MPDTDQQLRARVAELPLQWTTELRGSFAGESKEEFHDVIAAAHSVADEARLSLQRWIEAGRRAGLSWAEIGATLGISKQAAQQRFGGAPLESGEAGEGEIEVRLGATAFNEMRMLREEGRAGRELVGTGPMRLFFRQSDRTWEYKRLVALSRDDAERRLGDGWSLVSSWPPFHYFKRAAA